MKNILLCTFALGALWIGGMAPAQAVTPARTTAQTAAAEAAADAGKIETCRANAVTTADISACAQMETAAAQGKLAQATDALRRRAQEHDKDDAAYDVEKKFNDSVKAFEAYVETACLYEQATYTNGTFAPVAYTACKTALINQRAQYLQDALKQ